jgi:uncharacterized phage protein gp47/JayE
MDDPKLNTCGCCEVSVPATPEMIWNRPGLAAIRYRVGTYASFRQAMIEAIARSSERGRWTARTSDDYGIALLEMWAYLGDILTFYQERVANEAFLRTALLRESVLRLAALLDYSPSPGVAAVTSLAFTLEEGKQVKIPVGLRAQSVPGQDEKPQKFETSESLDAAVALNKVRVFPLRTAAYPFNKGSRGGILSPDKAKAIAEAVSIGDTLLFQGGNDILPVQVTQVTTDTDGYTTLKWTPPLQKNLGAATRVFKRVRVMRFFGHDAPQQYLKTTADTTQSSGVKIELKKRNASDYDVPMGKPWSLDAVYDDLKPGARLIIETKGKFKALMIVKTVAQERAEVPPLAATVTQISLSTEGKTIIIWAPLDRRRTVFHELAGPEITFWGYTFPGKIAAGTEKILLDAEGLTIKDLIPGRAVVLTDGKGKAERCVVKSVSLQAPFLVVKLKSPLKTSFDATTAYLHGNVAQATHGETVSNEVLGDGDPTETFQTFSLRKLPVTFVPKAGAPSGAGSTLRVRVDGVLWHAVRSFYGCMGDERVYTLTPESGVVRFGDGKRGARLPTGRRNVTATYRQGIGKDGNVKAGAIKTLLDRPVGLKSVLNPLAAQGGAEPETLDKARENAPNTVRTFGRIVSLRDFEDAAREYAGIAKARAVCAWDGETRAVHLTVAGDGGAQVTGTTYDNLVKDLNSRRDPNRKLVVEPGFAKIYLKIEAAIEVDAAYVAQVVRTAAVKALQAALAFENVNLGQPVHLSDIYQVIQDVTGVTAVAITRLEYASDEDRVNHGASAEAVQAHLPIYSNELAAVDPVSGIKVTIGIKKL